MNATFEVFGTPLWIYMLSIFAFIAMIELNDLIIAMEKSWHKFLKDHNNGSYYINKRIVNQRNRRSTDNKQESDSNDNGTMPG